MLSSPKLFISLVVALPVAAQLPPDVPSQYEEIYTNMTAKIGAFQTTLDQSWNKTPYPVAMAPHLSSAESTQYLSLLNPGYYQNTVLTELLQLQATGAEAVTVHINFPILYEPYYTYANTPASYAQYLAFYQQLATDVHARGLQLMTETTVTAALDGTSGAVFEPYYKSLAWDEYMSARAQNSLNVARLVKPDYESVICEPDSEGEKAYQPTENSTAGALQLLNTILTAFKNAHVSGVSVGAGAGSWIRDFTTYIQEFSATSLNYIDMHVYPVNNSYLTNLLAAATIIKAANKPMAMSEAWPDKIADSELRTRDFNLIDSRDVFSFWWPVDTAFLRAMVDCAQYEHFLFLSPSYPEYFATYLGYNQYAADTPAQLLPAEFSAAALANRAGTFNVTGILFSRMIVGVDRTAPVTPQAPTASSYSTSGATITWTPTTDNIGLAGYNIYRDGVVVSQLAVPPFYDSGLIAGATYTYTLSAFDAQGNASGESAPLTLTTRDLSPPSIPKNLALQSDTTKSVSLVWSASTGGGGVGGYRVLRGSSPTSLSIIAGHVPGTSYTDPDARPSTTYYYAVESYNLTGIISAPCTPIKVTTP